MINIISFHTQHFRALIFSGRVMPPPISLEHILDKKQEERLYSNNVRRLLKSSGDQCSS